MSDDEPFRITKAQKEKIISHVTKVLNNCPVCGGEHWNGYPYLTGERPYDPEAKYITISEAAPKARLTCQNCGFIVYFDATRIGIFSTAEETQDDG